MIIELTQSNNEFHYIHLYNVTEVSGASDRHKDKHCHQVVEKWYCSAVTVTTVCAVCMDVFEFCEIKFISKKV